MEEVVKEEASEVPQDGMTVTQRSVAKKGSNGEDHFSEAKYMDVIEMKLITSKELRDKSNCYSLHNDSSHRLPCSLVRLMQLRLCTGGAHADGAPVTPAPKAHVGHPTPVGFCHHDGGVVVIVKVLKKCQVN
ncbi:hypothetical protein VNO78_15932 [Psophocarpus tetragonolobus]|uniref:Uncharacterized protein n=1 Tax=Psophocarpus tetragonolobus TaxID=3891 RepID=A0AAN9SEY0_PSOTE